jgi:spermidine synthase
MEVNEELRLSLAGSRYMESACSADTASLYSISHCYWAGKTPYSEVVIAESPVFGKVLFLDKEIQSAESDEAIYHEHLVHPVLRAMDHVPSKRVLIVGGGEAATAREVLKWSRTAVARVDWVDIDGDLVNLCRRHLSWADDPVYNDSRLAFFGEDIRSFFTHSKDLYDVIILDLPDPDVDTLRGSAEDTADYMLYSDAFFQQVRAHLSIGGAVVSHAGPISPGGDPEVNREGLTWIREKASAVGLGDGQAYHTFIPSFQSEWGFWMSAAPSLGGTLPLELVVMDDGAQGAAFTWPNFWNSPFIGLCGR